MAKHRKYVRPPCKTCKHHVSVHMYKPDPEGWTNKGPQDCRVPGCECKEYVNGKEATMAGLNPVLL